MSNNSIIKHSKLPIGIFDSGIGGLTVANAIIQHLPNEEIVYFGDTKHLPYGDKSPSAIFGYSEKIADYLIETKKCKAIVIACNTASSIAYQHLRDKYKGLLPIVSVIDPIIEAIVNDNDIKKVGLIATKATISSGVYQEKLQRRKPSIEYRALATPLLVPMIEEGFYNNNISHSLIENYLSHTELQGIDALILGCTHYFIIRNEINEFYKHQVKLFDSTKIVAEKLHQILEKEHLLAPSRNETSHQFLVSDYTESFARTAQLFYQGNVPLELVQI